MAMEGLGFIMHWGFTPGVNVFANCDNVNVNDDKEINVLMSETGGDIRHLLKSITDILPLKQNRQKQIHIYYHEAARENLARLLLFLTLICETGISIRERMEMYLDLFGNTNLRNQTAAYLEEITPELIQLVTGDDKKCGSVIKDLIDFDTLKFKDRDEIENIVSSYLQVHKFDIEQLRDQRLRGHFKERYDHRRNMVDWDYNFGLGDFTKSVH